MTIKQSWEQWAQPTIIITLIMSVIYSTVWLVKLDDLARENAVDIAKMSDKVKEMTSSIASQSSIDAKTVAVFEAILRQVDSLDRRMSRNEENIIENTK